MTPDAPTPGRGGPPPPADVHAQAAQALGRAARLTRAELDYLFAALARLPSVRLAAARQLSYDLFERTEVDLVLLYRGLEQLRATHRDRLPTDPAVLEDQLGTACLAEAAKDPAGAFYTPAAREALLGDGGLLGRACRLAVSAEVETYALQLLGRFLTERKLADPLRAALANLGPGETVGGVTELYKLVERGWQAVAQAATNPVRPAVSADPLYRPPLPTPFTTGCPWLDVLLNGGHAAGEAYCLLGPTAGGKSACAIQIATEGARIQQAAARDGLESPGHWYYFSWELGQAELEQRAYAYGARVHVDTYRHNQPFSTARDLKPYELDPYINPPGLPPRGETERLLDYAREMGGDACRLQLIDWSGGTGLGCGGLDDVLTVLSRETTGVGRRVAGVVLDYAGIMYRRQIGANPRYKPGDLFELLNGCLDGVRSRVSIPYRCPVYVLHQFHGGRVPTAPGVALHHKDASGSRNMGDNADFALNIGNRDMKTGLLAFSVSKARRAPGRDEPVILQFDPRFNVFRTPGGSYMIDPFTQRIVDATTGAAIDADPGYAPPAPPPTNLPDVLGGN